MAGVIRRDHGFGWTLAQKMILLLDFKTVGESHKLLHHSLVVTISSIMDLANIDLLLDMNWEIIIQPSYFESLWHSIRLLSIRPMPY